MTGSRETVLGQLLGLVREHFYVPDGQPPAGWSIGRCGSVIKRLLALNFSASEIGAAIEGLAIMREAGELQTPDGGYWLKPGEKATMRALYTTRHGVRPLFSVAQEAVWRSSKRATSATLALKRAEDPVRVSDIIERLLPKRRS